MTKTSRQNFLSSFISQYLYVYNYCNVYDIQCLLNDKNSTQKVRSKDLMRQKSFSNGV